MRISLFDSGLVLLMLGATALNASAAEPARPVAATATVPAKATAVNSGHIEGFGQRVTGTALAKLRGGTQISENMTLTGSVDNDTANQVTTGFNSISAGSFNGAVGVPMVIQNTGNNVLIQNATIINVQFHP